MLSHSHYVLTITSLAVRYEARLDDGTLVASTSEDGVEFTVRDGQLLTAYKFYDIFHVAADAYVYVDRSFLSWIV